MVERSPTVCLYVYVCECVILSVFVRVCVCVSL